MTDRPILFSAPMVRALREGRKTQTRRVLKPRKGVTIADLEKGAPAFGGIGNWMMIKREDVQSPRVAPGDREWVRESWRTEDAAFDKIKPRDLPRDTSILFDADAHWSDNKSVGRKRPGMFMPQWASRLTLLIDAVRVERLQDISYDDAIAEGVADMSKAVAAIERHADDYDETAEQCSRRLRWPQRGFAQLWESINGAGSWTANPWVVVRTFRVVNANIDEVGRAPQ